MLLGPARYDCSIRCRIRSTVECAGPSKAPQNNAYLEGDYISNFVEVTVECGMPAAISLQGFIALR